MGKKGDKKAAPPPDAQAVANIDASMQLAALGLTDEQQARVQQRLCLGSIGFVKMFRSILSQMLHTIKLYLAYLPKFRVKYSFIIMFFGCYLRAVLLGGQPAMDGSSATATVPESLEDSLVVRTPPPTINPSSPRSPDVQRPTFHRSGPVRSETYYQRGSTLELPGSALPKDVPDASAPASTFFVDPLADAQTPGADLEQLLHQKLFPDEPYVPKPHEED